MVKAGNKGKCLLSINRSVKTIHCHHNMEYEGASYLLIWCGNCGYHQSVLIFRKLLKYYFENLCNIWKSQLIYDLKDTFKQ